MKPRSERPRTLPCGRKAPQARSLDEPGLGQIRLRLESYLRDRGLRFTEPRWKVAESVLRAGLHLDSREIVSAVKRNNPGVGEATVYRAIHLLCDAGILEESHQSAGGRTVYEIAGEEHHDHVLCSDCGEVFEFHDEELERLQEKIATRQGFSLLSHRHVLVGRCHFKQQAQPAKGSGTMRGNAKKLMIAAAALLQVMNVSSPMARAEPALSVDELMRRIDVLASEVETLKLGEVAARADQRQYGLGPAASKVYRSRQGVSVGGYGEIQYSDYGSSTRADTANQQRLVMYLGYKFSDRIIFNSELEFEYASSSGNRDGKNGSWGVEFAYLDFFWLPELNFRLGNILVPLGFVNELHEPTVFLGVRRPDIESAILPTTWREVGAGVFGGSGNWTYRSFLLTGFDAGGCRGSSCGNNGFDASGVRGGRQNASRATAEDWAWVTRVDYSPAPGATVGGGLFWGDSGQDQTDSSVPDVPTTIAELHAEYRRSGVELRALGAMTWIGNAAELNAAKGFSGTQSVGSRQYGAYVQLGYQLSSLGLDLMLTPFVRHERWDTQAAVPAGFQRNPARAQSSWTYGLQYKPLDQIVLTADFQDFSNGAGTAIDQFNLGLGFIF